MIKILSAILVTVAVVGSLLFLSPYSEKILGTENFADDILTFIYDLTSDTGFKAGHTCVFDKQNTDDKYRASAANCTDSAKYYYSCECGAKGNDKFDYGDPKGHNNQLLIQGDYKNSYLVGETFDATGMTAIIYCSDCENSATVENLTVPTTEPFTHSTDHKTLTVSAEGYSVDVYYRAMDYAVTNVELKADENGNKVYYVVSGRYAEGFDISNLFFSLTDDKKVYWSNEKASDKFNVEINETDRTFKMSLDITDASFEQNYIPYYYGNKTKGTNLVTDYTGKYDGMTLKVGNVTYTILHKKNPENMSTHGVPILFKTLDLFGPKYSASAVKLELDEVNGKVYYVVSGTSLGYTTANELRSDILMQFRNTNATIHLTHDFIEVFEYDAETGDYTFKIDVSELSVKENPYYTRFNEKDRTGAVPDFDGVSKSKVNTTPVSYNGKVYIIVYGGSGASNGYGTISVKVSEDDGAKFTATSIKLELDEANSKVYYVVSGTSEGYESLETFAADINFSMGNTTEENLAVTAFDVTTGAFTFKVDVTDIEIKAASQINKIGKQSGTLKNLNYIDPDGVDTDTKIKLNGKFYQIFYVPGGNTESTGYGAVSIKVASASQIATSVSLAVENDKVYYIINCFSLNYATKEELVADIQFQLRNRENGKAKTYLTASDFIISQFDASTGEFCLKLDITDLAVNNTNPYYTRIGNASGISDFNYIDVANVDLNPVTVNDKTYTLVYIVGSTERSEGYGTISVKITDN